MPPSATSLRALLRAHADPENAAGAQRWFVGGVKTYGVHREMLDSLAREAAAAMKASGGLPAALRIAGGLYRSRNMDEAALAGRILERFTHDVAPAQFAAVSLIPLARTGERLREIFNIADRLIGDPDDMVQKGVGWLPKEATRLRARGVISYLVARRDRTTRLVLRYACEKFPPAQRRRVLGPARR